MNARTIVADRDGPCLSTKAEDPAKQLRDWGNSLSYKLSEFAYVARAARALLHEYEGTERDEGLTGVSYLLVRLQEDCDRLSSEVAAQADNFAREARHD